MSGGDKTATLAPVPNGAGPLPGSAAAALKSDALETDAHAAAIQQQQQQQQQQEQPKQEQQQEERREGQAEAGAQQGDAQNAGAARVEVSRHMPRVLHNKPRDTVLWADGRFCNKGCSAAFTATLECIIGCICRGGMHACLWRRRDRNAARAFASVARNRRGDVPRRGARRIRGRPGQLGAL